MMVVNGAHIRSLRGANGPHMGGSSEKWAIASKNLQSGDLRSDEHPCPHLPTLAFLESLSSGLGVTELIICIFN